MQALTKYIGGHSDLLMGSVTVKDPMLYQQLGATQQLLGSAASPDDCSLALRGMRTMAVRLKHIEASALQVARWLAARPEIELVLHPALGARRATSCGSVTLRVQPGSFHRIQARSLKTAGACIRGRARTVPKLVIAGEA